MFKLHVCAIGPKDHQSSDPTVLIQRRHGRPVKFMEMQQNDLLSAVAFQHKPNQGTIQLNIIRLEARVLMSCSTLNYSMSRGT